MTLLLPQTKKIPWCKDPDSWPCWPSKPRSSTHSRACKGRQLCHQPPASACSRAPGKEHSPNGASALSRETCAVLLFCTGGSCLAFQSGCLSTSSPSHHSQVTRDVHRALLTPAPALGQAHHPLNPRSTYTLMKVPKKSQHPAGPSSTSSSIFQDKSCCKQHCQVPSGSEILLSPHP